MAGSECWHGLRNMAGSEVNHRLRTGSPDRRVKRRLREDFHAAAESPFTRSRTVMGHFLRIKGERNPYNTVPEAALDAPVRATKLGTSSPHRLREDPLPPNMHPAELQIRN